MELVGVEVPADAAAVETMVTVYAEEYGRLRWDRDRILAAFRMPRYASAHGAWRVLGEARTAELVEEALERFTPPARGGDHA
jgi:hypothetical protein